MRKWSYDLETDDAVAVDDIGVWMLFVDGIAIGYLGFDNDPQTSPYVDGDGDGVSQEDARLHAQFIVDACNTREQTLAWTPEVAATAGRILRDALRNRRIRDGACPTCGAKRQFDDHTAVAVESQHPQ